MTNLASSVFLEIIEQPAANKLRFRFASESPSGSLPGKRSTDKQKTFPTIRIHGYNGPAEVRVSCVEHNALPNTNSYRVHPHKIGNVKRYLFMKNWSFSYGKNAFSFLLSKKKKNS